ncbi:hypothetical protein C1Y40_04184 [Mycobacterium talmoniae]|uniref:Uncharacterized protein n=1 Tax=Mycobacterium talmoniae TaxID=1858794 RepID=A0A2S8BG56_9MYCO|nr:hypothetical protein C1Y40_04184 [Mycobacterium talmoniae]
MLCREVDVDVAARDIGDAIRFEHCHMVRNSVRVGPLWQTRSVRFERQGPAYQTRIQSTSICAG